MSAYFTGLGLAFLMVGAVLAATTRLSTLVDVWAFSGFTTVAVLALAVGPFILLLRRWLGPTLTVPRAAAAGVIAGLLVPLPVWLLTRESYETPGNLLQFWLRLPMEFVIGVLPYVAASALFAGWLVAEGAARRRKVFS